MKVPNPKEHKDPSHIYQRKEQLRRCDVTLTRPLIQEDPVTKFQQFSKEEWLKISPQRCKKTSYDLMVGIPAWCKDQLLVFITSSHWCRSSIVPVEHVQKVLLLPTPSCLCAFPSDKSFFLLVVCLGDMALQQCLLGMEFSGRDPSGQRVMGLLPAKGLATAVEADKRFLWEVPLSWLVSLLLLNIKLPTFPVALFDLHNVL